MNLFINLSNLVQGGSLQVAHSFLSEINKLTLENNYLVVSNKNFYIDISLFDNKFQFKIVESSPSKFSNRFKIGKKLIDMCKLAGVNAVKFQKRSNKNLFTKKIYDSLYDNKNSYGRSYGAHREKLELSIKL